MRKVYISRRTIIGILIGLVSLYIFFVNSYRFIVYQPFHLLNLYDVTERDLKSGSYICGEIKDCFKVSHITNTGWVVYEGNDAGMFDGAHFFCSYTVPIAKDQYIRIWLQEGKDAQKSIEDILQGKVSVVSFTGQIKKSTIAINKEFYDDDPNFDQTKIISEFSIWEKGTDSERNYILLGLMGMFFAWLVYRSDGGIIVSEVENAEPKANRSYNQKKELDLAIILLNRYRAEEKTNRKKIIWGVILIVMGVYLDFGLEIIELKMLGLLILLFGMGVLVKAILNTSNRVAVWIAKKLSLQTLQTKINEQEKIIKKLQL